jgi:shikimate dehydrogenase
MPRLGVVGWPVAHSRSPAMHAAAFAALGMTDWVYQLLPVPPELFDETVRALPGAGFVGANVTVPHKLAALALADEASEPARAIGAANTLLFDDGGAIRAENTDAPGLLASLPIDPTGRSALVLGAGGSARAAVWALVQAGAQVAIWNRTHARAEALARDFGVRAVTNAEPADFLINCTSAGLNDPGRMFKSLPVNADELGEYACVVDLVYRDDETPLLRAAARRGAAVVSGLEVLVAQGAISFELWTGLAAPLAAMREAAAAR